VAKIDQDVYTDAEEGAVAMTRDINELIGLRVQAARKQAGLSQEDVGRRLGLSQNGYGQYERGMHPFTVEQLLQLAAILGHSIEYFIGQERDLAPDEDRLLALYRQTRTTGLDALTIKLVEAVASHK
jgi:transcriptional regulator with XRE-family HTH domain